MISFVCFDLCWCGVFLVLYRFKLIQSLYRAVWQIRKNFLAELFRCLLLFHTERITNTNLSPIASTYHTVDMITLELRSHTLYFMFKILHEESSTCFMFHFDFGFLSNLIINFQPMTFVNWFILFSMLLQKRLLLNYTGVSHNHLLSVWKDLIIKCTFTRKILWDTLLF